MSSKQKKSKALATLEKITGGPVTFGKLLRSIREGATWTQVKMAKKLGISKSHLNDIEKQRKSVNLKIGNKNLVQVN